MNGPNGRTLRCLACLLPLTILAVTSSRAADKPSPSATTGGAAADRASLYTLPGEEPPQAFVPLRPRTVEERRQVEALTQYSAARAFEHENLWSDAIALLEKALAIEPDSAAILKRLSGLCFALGKTDQALTYGKRVLESDPGDTDTIGQLVAYFVKHDAASAESLLRGVLENPRLDKDSPGSLLARLELGRLYAGKLQKMDRAADEFAKVVEALDDKAANRLTPADQKRLLGGEEAAASTYLEFGVVFLATDRHDLAIKAFRRGLVYDEDDPQLPLLLAQTLLKSGKGEEALALVDDYLKRQPQGAEAYELLAKILTELHRAKEITPRLEAAAKLDSKNILLQYTLADHYREIGQTEKAERMYKTLLAAQPTTQAYGALATSLFKRKKTDDLLKVMTEALARPGAAEVVAVIEPLLDSIERDPGYCDELLDAGLRLLSADPPGLDPRATLNILTHIASRTEKFDKLIALQRLLLKRNPSPLAYREVADTLVRMRKFDDAASMLDELMAKYPDQKGPALLISLGKIRRAAEQNDPALAAAREAIKLDPNDGDAQVLLIQLLSQTGKLDEAVEFARKALKNDPSNPEFNRMLGFILTQFGRTDEAIALYRGLLERFPNNREVVKLARSGLSVAYTNQGDFAKGEAELEQLLQLDPDEAGVNNDLGYLYADQGKHLEKAEAMIRKALQEEPDNVAYLDSLGWVLFKRGRVKEAVGPLEKAVQDSSGGGDATIFEHLGDVYFQLQETKKAKTAWEQAEKSAAKAIPSDRRLTEIRKKLESLEKLGTTPKPTGDDTP